MSPRPQTPSVYAQSLVTTGPGRLRYWLLWLGLLLGTSVCAQRMEISVSDVAGLRAAVLQANADVGSAYTIRITVNELQFTEFAGSGAALPAIGNDIAIVGRPNTVLRGGGPGSNFRFAEVQTGGQLFLTTLQFDGFESMGNGGVIAVASGGGLSLYGELNEEPSNLTPMIFANCRSGGQGGAVYAADDTVVDIQGTAFWACQATSGGAVAFGEPASAHIFDSEFNGNQAQSGGAIHANGPISVTNNHFRNNNAAQFGGALDLRGPGGAQVSGNRFEGNSGSFFACDVNAALLPESPGSYFRNNQLFGPGCDASRVDNPSGTLFWMSSDGVNTFVHTVVNSRGRLEMSSSLMSNTPGPNQHEKALCADFGSGAIRSLGANIVNDGSCFLDQPSDLPNTDPDLTLVDGILTISADSPSVDRGPAGVIFPEGATGPAILPCGYRDIRGLGRPQDGDGDGLYECDSGSYEIQAGPDLVLGQSGIYYDAARSGEGHFLERIGGGLALVSTFTYGPNGGMAWFIGIGAIVGNSVVIDQMLGTRGGVYGSQFDETAIERYRVGGLSLVFGDCDADSMPGHMAFQADPREPFEDLSTAASRLTSVVPCSGAASANAWRSGAYYAVGRSGEGIFVQYLPDGRAVLVYYGYTPGGQQFWAISGAGVSVDGNVLTAPMLYPATTTRFGQAFDPAEIVLQPWATVRLTQSGCNTAILDIEPSVSAYTAASLEYTRLTQIEGTACPPAGG
jgi:predicted outer membrane repeat protein